MRRHPVLIPVALLLLISLLVPAPAAEPSRVQKLSRVWSAEFENTARETLAAIAEKPASLQEVAEIYEVIAGRGGSPGGALTQLAAKAVHSVLTAPELEKRYTLADGIALWHAVRGKIYAERLRPVAARAIRRLASVLDDDALTKAFLDVSPAVQRQPVSMNAAEIHAEDLKRVQRVVLFWLLSDRWIERELAKLKQAPLPTFRCPDFAGKVPEELRDLPPECAAAWKEAARANAWMKARAGESDAPSPERLKAERSDAGAPNLEAVIDRFFQAPQEIKLDELARFYWTSGFWCGTGGEAFNAVKSRMVLLLHLRDRNIPAALRAMLNDSANREGVPPALEDPNNWRLHLLELCGLDWDKLFSSELLPYLERNAQGLISSSFGEELLVARGSHFAGRVLLAVETQSLERASLPPGPSGIGRFVRADRILRFITPGDVPPGSRPEIPREIQDELVKLLLVDLRRDRGYVALANSLGALARLKRPEITEAIRPHLDSPFDYVRQNAAEAMAYLGEAVPPRQRRASGARFRIFLNDVLWPAQPESFATIEYKSAAQGWNGNHSITSRHTREDELVFEHDAVVEAKDKMIEARLVMRPATGLGRPAKSGLAQPWFAAPVKLPISFDEVNEVRVKTEALRIHLVYPPRARELQGEMLSLKLEWLDAPKRESHQRREVPAAVFQEPMREQYDFAALQPGRYRFAVTAPGTAPVTMDTIDVKPGMDAVKIILSSAATVSARLKLPEFEKREDLPVVALQALHPEFWLGQVPIAKLLQDGKEIAAATFISQTSGVSFPNVPPGKYRIRVLGPEDLVLNSRQQLRTEGGEPARAAWKRAELAVEVRADSPAVVDVGEIQLEKISLPAR